MAYVDSTPGSYAEERVIDASRVVKLPDGISDQQAAAMMLKGLTAWFLLRRCYRVRKNDPIVLHAATGGVGLIALQWATALGAKVIAVVGSDAKAALAREHRRSGSHRQFARGPGRACARNHEETRRAGRL